MSNERRSKSRKGSANQLDVLDSKVEAAVSKAVEGMASQVRTIREALLELTNKTNDHSGLAQLAKEAADAAVAEQISLQQGSPTTDGLTTPTTGTARLSKGLYTTLESAKNHEKRIACLMDG